MATPPLGRMLGARVVMVDIVEDKLNHAMQPGAVAAVITGFAG